MREQDYPALYQAADRASRNAQSAYLACIKAYAGFSILGAGLGLYGVESKISAIFSAIVFSMGLLISGLMALKKFENTWYRARAVAESIKTSTWRFIMRAEPFHSVDGLANEKSKFRELLHRILKEHKDLAAEFSGPESDKEQISDAMLSIRESGYVERKNIYNEKRIEDQRNWYSNKSKFNKSRGTIWFIAFAAAQIVAIALTIFRVAYPDWKFIPIEVFVVLGASILGWIQAKRYRELSAAYSLAAQEIGIAKSELSDVKSDDEFSKFVADTESAFSREHTQWVARKD